MKEFKLHEINLTSNKSILIEASAGTGKTFSLGMLFLRLLIEKEIPANKILMVTFTNAAVEEIKQRLLKLIEDCSIYAENNFGLNDSLINVTIAKDTKGLIDGYLNKSESENQNETEKGRDKSESENQNGNGLKSENENQNETEKRKNKSESENQNGSGKERGKWKEPEKLKEIILNAKSLSDELAIYTIHSFSQTILKEYAFDTGQIFQRDLLTNDEDLREEAIIDVWRKEITTLPYPTLEYLLNEDFKYSDLNDIVKLKLSGAQCAEEFRSNELPLFDKYKINLDSITKRAEQHYNENNKKLKLFKDYDFDGALNKTFAEIKSNKFTKMVQDSGFIEFAEEINIIRNAFIFKTLDYFTNKIVDKFHAIKEEKGILTFNDLIRELHTIVTDSSKNGNLIKALQRKFHAVFIDEFQDTDIFQYEIFSTLFRKENQEFSLFYIGDPKQSIYAFRMADLDTYFEAAKASEVYTMKTNYRSSVQYLRDVNQFFNIPNPFLDNIEYVQVNHPNNNLSDVVLPEHYGDKALIHFTESNPERYTMSGGVSKIAVELLNKVKFNGLPIRPSDVAILVYRKRDGLAIQQELNKYFIPSVIADDNDLLNTPEADFLLRLMIAIQEPEPDVVRECFISPLLLPDYEKLHQIDWIEYIADFKKIQANNAGKGIYSYILEWMEHFNAITRLLAQPEGNRILSNLFQVLELLQEKQSASAFDMNDLIQWYKTEINRGRSEKKQRLESDEAAVQIVTIHKSKGLQYKFVILPEPTEEKSIHNKMRWLQVKNKQKYFQYHRVSSKSKVIYMDEVRQEYRRILYVALTRAEYLTVMYSKDTEKISTFADFHQDHFFKTHDFNAYVPERNNFAPEKKYAQAAPDIKYKPYPVQRSWITGSFSGLSPEHEFFKKEKKAVQGDYDTFIWENLPSGAKTGSFIHALLENINFNESTYWKKAIDQQLNYHLIWGKEIEKNKDKTPNPKRDKTIQHLTQLLDHLMEVPLGDTLRLSQVQNKLIELEFYYTVPTGKWKEVQKLFPHPIDFRNDNLEGYLNGFIDLVFEYEGKYYILDWKTNHLGYTLEDFSKEKVWDAMAHNNYHLQYLIYTIALVRYLKLKMGKDFDYDQHIGGVFYLFIRGIRKDSEAGVFYNRIDKNALMAIEKVINNE